MFSISIRKYRNEKNNKGPVYLDLQNVNSLCLCHYVNSCVSSVFQLTHIETGGFGAGVLGHPTASFASQRAPQNPVSMCPGCPSFYVCKITRPAALELFLMLKKRGG